MGGGSKGPAMRPELPVALAPSPTVSPVEQPNPPMQQNYAQYYMPSNPQELRQSLLTQYGYTPFGIRSAYKQVAPNSSYAAPRMPQTFKPSGIVAPSMNDPVYEARLRELEERLAASGGGDGRMDGGGYGGGGGNN